VCSVEAATAPDKTLSSDATPLWRPALVVVNVSSLNLTVMGQLNLTLTLPNRTQHDNVTMRHNVSSLAAPNATLAGKRDLTLASEQGNWSGGAPSVAPGGGGSGGGG